MMKPLAILVCAALVASTTGCASLSLPFIGGKADIVRPTPQNPVMDVLTIWQPGEGRGLDNLPSRGLAGQLMFFTYREAVPALVEGDVTLYLFDDQGTEEEQSRPIWQRTFTAAEWNAFATETTLGTAYQLFVPYVRKGSHEAHCSVQVKFEPSDGGAPVYSKMTHVRLPGPKSRRFASSIRRNRIESKPYDPSLVNRLGTSETDPSSSEELQTTTLQVPGQRRLANASNARLRQLAEEMVQDEQVQSAIQQAGYTTESAAAAVPTAEDGGRYRLYR